jgi:pimeloyl-ACP methyl ester carboxylesterase
MIHTYHENAPCLSGRLRSRTGALLALGFPILIPSGDAGQGSGSRQAVNKLGGASWEENDEETWGPNAPTLLIAGQYDTWSYPEDREGLMRDLVHAPVKQSVLIPDATHFVLFEKNRLPFFDAILKFLKE